MTARAERTEAFAQARPLSPLDHLGRRLSTARIRRALPSGPLGRAADVGCGYDAALGRDLFPQAAARVFIDIAVNPSLADARTAIIEGRLPGALAAIETASCDAVICNNVIEHLWEPQDTLAELRRITSQRGVCVINVPSWLGKRALEFSAFRVGLSPREEMDDHKAYFDPRDLWPLLVRAGFMPSQISCRRHKLFLNTIAVCRPS